MNLCIFPLTHFLVYFDANFADVRLELTTGHNAMITQ